MSESLVDRLRTIQQRCEMATKGPWELSPPDPKYFTPSFVWSKHKRAWDEEDEEYNAICSFPRTSEYGYGSDSHIEPDAKFIAHARTDLPVLLRVIDKLLEQRGQLMRLAVKSSDFMAVLSSQYDAELLAAMETDR